MNKMSDELMGWVDGRDVIVLEEYEMTRIEMVKSSMTG